jgi:hypothetical protein
MVTLDFAVRGIPEYRVKDQYSRLAPRSPAEPGEGNRRAYRPKTALLLSTASLKLDFQSQRIAGRVFGCIGKQITRDLLRVNRLRANDALGDVAGDNNPWRA